MATQSHRSNGSRGPYDGGTAGLQSTTWTAFVLPATNSLGNRNEGVMISSGTIHVKVGKSWIGILLFLFALLLLTAVPARAQSVGGCVANFGGVIDGFVNPAPPSQINIDGNCTIRNFPASNPLTSNISFSGTGRGWLVVFDNVDFVGNLSCDKSHGNFIWFVNGSTTRAHILTCANLFVPVDKIDKENPPGPPFVSIGVPFTYTLTFPQLVSATTGAVVNPNGSNRSEERRVGKECGARV